MELDDRLGYSKKDVSGEFSAARALNSLLGGSPEGRLLYKRIRSEVTPIKSTQYDIAAVCNLTCEGCLFFAGSDHNHVAEERDAEKIDEFFASEAARGVNFGQFAGAEPSLRQDILHLAAKHVHRGVVFTNGTIKIKNDLPYMIHVSIWGLGNEGAALRGADVTDKAFRNYRDDSRAVFVFTITATNLESIPDVVKACRNNNARLTFSHFTPTTEYLQWMGEANMSEADYFRLGSTGAKMVHDSQSLFRVRQLVDEAMASYPEGIIYSKAFNRWINQPGGIYDIDPATRIATNCGSRTSKSYRHYRPDFSDAGDVKCCAPNLDCSQCRAYAFSLSTAITRIGDFAKQDGGVQDWLEIWNMWCKMNIVGWDG